MLIFTIIAIVIIFFLWFNTSVYNYIKMGYYWGIDESSERRLPFTIWRVLVLALLLIPWWNIDVFIVYLIWYLKRACNPEPDDRHVCIIYRLDVEKYSPFLYNAISSIGDLLNKRIV